MSLLWINRFVNMEILFFGMLETIVLEAKRGGT